MPKIVNAGIAQSTSVGDDVYSGTKPRKRYLWIEFDEPVKNPNDSYVIRVLAYSPDPLLAKLLITSSPCHQTFTLLDQNYLAFSLMN